MTEQQTPGPESSAERVALWRAIHAQEDALPHVIEDQIGLELLAPDQGWRDRPDMDLHATKLFRASIVARARFIEDLVAEQMAIGIGQYIILGAGLDTFAQRKPDIGSKLTIFEVDQAGPQEWKRNRLNELGYCVPPWLRLVPANFEQKDDWMKQLKQAGYDSNKPAVVASTGVTMYLSKEAVASTLRQLSTMAAGSTLAMTFLLPVELVAPGDRAGREMSQRGAKASGTPFISFYAPEEMVAMTLEAGFKNAHTVSGRDLASRYFSNRTDGLDPGNSENIVVATT